MHELGIAEAALQQTLEHARGAGATQVGRIGLRVGEWSGVDADALEFALRAILPGTMAAGAAIEIERVAAAAYCPECTRDFEPGEDFLFTCPSCQRTCPTLVRGRELALTRLEIETSHDPSHALPRAGA